MPKSFDKKVILLKTEVTEGTDAAPVVGSMFVGIAIHSIWEVTR